jgi:glyoxylase-like metal-dependent hydrolase (beta-lactamase superfamily II)
MHRPISKRILKHLLALILVLALPIPVGAGDVLRGELVKGESLSKEWRLPVKAIDTQEIPEVILDAKAASDKPLPVYRLTDNTYFLFGNIAILDEKNRGWNGNAGFIVTTDGVVVIDSLGTPKLGRRLIATIRTITPKPIKYLIVTHNHPDHAYGSSAFRQLKGITIIAHKGTIDYNHSATLQASVDYRQSLLPQDMEGFSPLKADIYIDTETFSNKRIRLGDAVFDIYNTGTHHSYGDLIVHQVNERIIWLSDLAFNQRTTYMGDGDSAQILAAEDWLMKKFHNIQLMVPGHGSAQTPPFPMVGKTHDYVTRMREAMRKAVENDVGLFEAVKNVEFEDWKDTRLYEQNQRANANFVYREMEKAYFDNF